MLGLDRKTVLLVPYQEEWKKLFDSEERLIRGALGETALAVEHIGSTSIPGIKAKPIIDIMVGIRDLSELEKAIPALEKIGYEYRGEQGIKGRPFFRKGTVTASTYHLSVVEHGGEIWRKHKGFRDYLLKHKDAARKYNELKRNLAAEFKDDREAYTDGKTKFVEEILRLSREK